MDHDFTALIDDALGALWQRDPVSATFAGEWERNAVLPRADATAEADELRALDELAARLSATAIPDSAAARLDARHLGAYCDFARSDFARTARYRNPAWYTGEATFGLIGLLLAGANGEHAEALAARLDAIPAFLADAGARLADVPIPAAWVARAQTELAALSRLVNDGLLLHPAGRARPASAAVAVTDACVALSATIAAAPDTDAACGEAHLGMLIERVHGLHETPAELERRAAAAFAAVHDELEAQARVLDPTRTWREQLAALSAIGPAADEVLSSYREWDARALREASELLTPASEYGLSYEPLPEWARAVAGDLYFLFYRSPAARQPGSGSTYWVMPARGSADDIRRAHNTAAVKLVHAVHHGSIGHHTQNARARTADSRFARIAGTDTAAGIALLAAGTMAEGWACYAEDLLAEIPDFYTPAERLQLIYFELRNIAGCLADLRFHSGAYTLAQMQAFYRDDVAFAPGRIESETTRNTIFPGSRVMYWTGTQQIKTLRAQSALPAKAFHDTLLGFGSAPVAWIGEELAR